LYGGAVFPAYKFDGKERDSESGLDNFGARYNSSPLGRFMSPDPSSIDGDLVDSENPQAWNMYSYVLNNPLNAVDPDGLDYYLLGGSSCNTDGGPKCDKQGYVLGSDGNRQVVTDQQIIDGIATVGANKNGDLTITTGQGTFKAELFGTPSTTVTVTPSYDDLKFDALLSAGKLGDAGVKAAMVLTAPEYLAMGISFGLVELSGEGVASLGQIRAGVGQSRAARIAAQGGKKALQRGLRSLAKRIAEHEAKIAEARAAGGFTSSMEAEVQTWKFQVQAMENILRMMP